MGVIVPSSEADIASRGSKRVENAALEVRQSGCANFERS